MSLWRNTCHVPCPNLTCVGKLTTIGSDNGLSPGQRQAIIRTIAGTLLIGPLGTNFSDILIRIQTFSFKKMHLKMWSAKWRPFVSAPICWWKIIVCKVGECEEDHMKAAVIINIHPAMNGIVQSSMMTSSNGNIFRVTGPLCGELTGPGEFPTQRPVTRSFDVYFDLRPNKRLRKQWRGWWFETQSCSLWRHCNEIDMDIKKVLTCWNPVFLRHLFISMQLNVVSASRV